MPDTSGCLPGCREEQLLDGRRRDPVTPADRRSNRILVEGLNKRSAAKRASWGSTDGPQTPVEQHMAGSNTRTVVMVMSFRCERNTHTASSSALKTSQRRRHDAVANPRSLLVACTNPALLKMRRCSDTVDCASGNSSTMWLHMRASLRASIRRILTRIGWPMALANAARSASVCGSSEGPTPRWTTCGLSGEQHESTGEARTRAVPVLTRTSGADPAAADSEALTLPSTPFSSRMCSGPG